jgi:hypothetical protein
VVPSSLQALSSGKANATTPRDRIRVFPTRMTTS